MLSSFEYNRLLTSSQYRTATAPQGCCPAMLEGFNEGMTGPGSCDEDDSDDMDGGY